MEPGTSYSEKLCKYCKTPSDENNGAESLRCTECHEIVHSKCLKRGAVPGGLASDVFFQFICQECSTTGSENFIRDRMPWLQAILLSLYHMQLRSPGLAKKGYFHWKVHIAAFIDRNWDIIFRKDFKRKKKWMGTISGTLSHYSPQFFKSGTMQFGEQGWWTLTYPKLVPNTIVQLNLEVLAQKQKLKEQKVVVDEVKLLQQIMLSKPWITDEIIKTTTEVLEIGKAPSNPPHAKPSIMKPLESSSSEKTVNPYIKNFTNRKRPMLPTVSSLSSPSPKRVKKKSKSANSSQLKIRPQAVKPLPKDFMVELPKIPIQTDTSGETNKEKPLKPLSKYLDPMCHYNTSLYDINRIRALTMETRLMGGVRKDLILSPYTSIYLQPYIRRDITINPPWLTLMDELQTKVNGNKANWKLKPRGPLDFVYVQPEHIPAINSLCNQFFWTGIDVSDCLKYPDFSCVVMYRKLVVGFALIVPDVNINECYVTVLFTRPGWRNSGIARFMLYHLIQTSRGRDITLHVSISNSALFLYQKYGFKVECVALDFYKKYIPDDVRESKHAFFCRLER